MIRNRHYSFSTVAPGILGVSYTNVRLASILDFRDALTKRNVVQIQAAVYPAITQRDKPMEEYDYFVFRTSSGEEVILADAWINQASIIETSSQDATIVIRNTDTVTLETLRGLMSVLDLQYTITLSNTVAV